MRRIRARIAGTGSCLPTKILTNHQLAQFVDTTDEWIRDRTGIEQRHIVANGEFTSDLAVRAAEQAMQAAGITASDLDLIIVATSTPDLVFPATATIVQKKLGADVNHIPAFDIQAVCTGFIYALTVAEKFIAAGTYRYILVAGADTFSRIVDWTDRATCVLFGDGAGAVILEASEGDERGILSTHIHADGSFTDLLKASSGSTTTSGPSHPSSPLVEGIGYVQMRGNEVFKQAVTVLGQIVDETLAANGLEKSQIDWLVPHQANVRIIQSTAKRLGLSMDQVVVTVNLHGNTSAASVPLALDVAVRDGRIQPGHLVLLEAFGGGFTWGSVLIRW